MILVPFFEFPQRDRLAKNVKSQCVQIIPRSPPNYALHVSSSLLWIQNVSNMDVTNEMFITMEEFILTPDIGDHKSQILVLAPPIPRVLETQLWVM